MNVIRTDPDIEKEIKGTKTELEDKVKMILKLIKDGDLVMDGTLEEIFKREPFAELVKDIGSITNELNVLQNKVESLEQVKSDLEAQNGEKNLQQEKLVEEKNNLASQLRNLKEKSEMLEAKVKEEESEKLKAKNKVESLEHQKSDLEKEADRKSQEQATLVEDQKKLASQLRNLKEKSEKLEAQVKEEESEKLKAKDAAENFKKQILELDRKSRESEKKISDLENVLNLITEENSCRLNQIETLKMELSKIDELAEIKEEGKKIVQEHEDLLKLLLTEAKKKAQTAAIRQLSVHIQNLKKYDNDLKEIMSRRRSCSKCCFC